MKVIAGPASRTLFARTLAEPVIVLLAIAASITGITNGFALDDITIVSGNASIHRLADFWRLFTEPYWPPEAGSSLYRPMTSLGFALQWAIGGGSPLPFHAVSIALYAAVCGAVFRLSLALIEWRTAWLAAALFAVHPVHVEAVANVVGQAELWAALFTILAVTRFVKRRKVGNLERRDVFVIASFYAAALLFKEHAIVLPAFLIAAEVSVVGSDTSFRAIAARLKLLMAATAVVAVVFIVIRTTVLGSLHGAGASPIFFENSFATRFYTLLTVVMEWLRLFLWPASLSADYSPSRIVPATAFDMAMLPGVSALVGMVVLAVLWRRKRPVIAFAIAWAGIALAIPSNLIVVTGFALAERTLFLASAGVTLAIAIGFARMTRLAVANGNHGGARFTRIAAAALISLGIARSATRSPVWRDNTSLIIQTVRDAPTSARAHLMMAQLHIDRRQYDKALDESLIALRLGSQKDPQLFAFTADVLQMNGQCAPAGLLYERSLSLYPSQPQVRINAATCLAQLGRRDRPQARLSGQPVSSDGSD